MFGSPVWPIVSIGCPKPVRAALIRESAQEVRINSLDIHAIRPRSESNSDNVHLFINIVDAVNLFIYTLNRHWPCATHKTPIYEVELVIMQ